MKPVICSFYTYEYATLATQMRASAEKFGYKTNIIEIEKINNSWLDTIYWRPEFLLERLKALKTPIVWLDCDAIIEQDPILFETMSADFASHIHSFRWAKDEVLGGTMYFAYTAPAIKLLETWIGLNKTMPKQNLSQKVLKEALKYWQGKMTILPATYCQIFDHMKDCGKPVISQHQASRKFRGTC